MDIETIKNLLEDILKDIGERKWTNLIKSYGLKINFDINDLGEDTNISKEEKEIKKAREIFDKMNETRISGLIEVEYPFPTQFEKEPITIFLRHLMKINEEQFYMLLQLVKFITR